MAICNCIKDKCFRFDLDVLDSSTILYQDLSDWVELDGDFEKPSSYEINIIPPGTNKGIPFTVNTNGKNNLSPTIPCRDGIYCIEFENCGVTYRKQVGIFPQIECCLQRVAGQGSKESQSKLTEARKYLQMTKASVEFDNIESAQTSLQMVKSIMKNISCDCGC